ncbi:MAG: hypothetical protein KG003_13670 [Bacteroidetes bacterium]|nr:hypothetical protein [Bacteroidota bacterium]
MKFHSPIMPYQIFPSNEIIKVGDTIWINAGISNNMKDFETGEIVNYNNVEFNSTLYFYEFLDTNKFLFREDSTQYANQKFIYKTTVGSSDFNGNIYRVGFVRKNDSIFYQSYAIAKDTGFFAISMGYNPGSSAHGSQEIKVGDSKCTHKLSTLCQSINNAQSTLYMATNKGFKPWYSPGADKLEYWIYHNRMYFFSVVK